MIHLPLLRAGKPYRSLATQELTDLRNGETVAEVSQANAGLIARDLALAPDNRRALEAMRVADLVEISRRAARLLVEATLPLGDGEQSPEDYLRQLSVTTGLPVALARANLEKLRYVLDEMETVLGGLTRGLYLGILDKGWGEQEGRCVSYRRETEVLGLVLPSNSPGVHSLWLPALPLKVPLAIKPGSQETWTPYRVAQAFLVAGCPPEAFGFYPTDYAGAGEILLRAGRSLLFGDRSTVEPWEGDPRVQIHGPGWSKVVFGRDRAGEWHEYLDLLVCSVADNSGRSCINASGIWTPAHGRELARGLAERLAAVDARPLDDPKARLAAFPSRTAAERQSAYIDSQLRIPGAEDLTAQLRPDGRVVEVDGCSFVLPTVIYCKDPAHPLAQAEFLFPYVSVVELQQEEVVDRMGATLVVTAITEDHDLHRELLGATHIDRLNLGAIATSRVDWDQPHEGNLFEHLYRQRALQRPDLAASGAAGAHAG